MSFHLGWFPRFLLVGVAACLASSVWAKEDALKALIVTGQSNHNWRVSTPIVQGLLEKAGLFGVDVAVGYVSEQRSGSPGAPRPRCGAAWDNPPAQQETCDQDARMLSWRLPSHQLPHALWLPATGCCSWACKDPASLAQSAVPQQASSGTRRSRQAPPAGPR